MLIIPRIAPSRGCWLRRAPRADRAWRASAVEVARTIDEQGQCFLLSVIAHFAAVPTGIRRWSATYNAACLHPRPVRPAAPPWPLLRCHFWLGRAQTAHRRPRCGRGRLPIRNRLGTPHQKSRTSTSKTGARSRGALRRAAPRASRATQGQHAAFRSDAGTGVRPGEASNGSGTGPRVWNVLKF